MARNWFIIRGDGREGPLTAAQLREMAAAHLLHADDLLIADDLLEPVAASRLRGLLPPTPPTATDASNARYSHLRRMQLHLRSCLGLVVGGMLAFCIGARLMPQRDRFGPFPPLHPLLVIGGLLNYLPVVYLPIIAWKTTELLGWPPGRRIRYTLSSVIPTIGIIPNLMLLAETAATIRSLPAPPNEHRPPSPLWFRSRQTATNATRWARDHIIASLLIAAGLGAAGRYAAGRIFFSPRQADIAATSRTNENAPAETREAVAIRRVLHAIRDATWVDVQLTSVSTIVEDLSKISRVDCPADFRAAYVDLLSALRRGQHADETRRAFESQPRDAIIAEGFLRGAFGDPFGKARELRVEDKRTAAALAAAMQELDAAFARLSDIALGYGVDFQDAQR